MTSVDEAIHHGSHFFNQTGPCTEKYNIPHHLLDVEQIKKRFPQFKLKGNKKGYFEEKAGYLRPELAIETQLDLVQRYGAQLVLNEKVFDISAHAEYVNIETNRGKYQADKTIYLCTFFGNEISKTDFGSVAEFDDFRR